MSIDLVDRLFVHTSCVYIQNFSEHKGNGRAYSYLLLMKPMKLESEVNAEESVFLLQTFGVETINTFLAHTHVLFRFS